MPLRYLWVVFHVFQLNHHYILHIDTVSVMTHQGATVVKNPHVSSYSWRLTGWENVWDAAQVTTIPDQVYSLSITADDLPWRSHVAGRLTPLTAISTRGNDQRRNRHRPSGNGQCPTRAKPKWQHHNLETWAYSWIFFHQQLYKTTFFC